jgi:hypothetical protein
MRSRHLYDSSRHSRLFFNQLGERRLVNLLERLHYVFIAEIG